MRKAKVSRGNGLLGDLNAGKPFSDKEIEEFVKIMDNLDPSKCKYEYHLELMKAQMRMYRLDKEKAIETIELAEKIKNKIDQPLEEIIKLLNIHGGEAFKNGVVHKIIEQLGVDVDFASKADSSEAGKLLIKAKVARVSTQDDVRLQQFYRNSKDNKGGN